jgi:flavin reductase (DIM6/NTAB) family NADH-FMN oxidoreductase RutF
MSELVGMMEFWAALGQRAIGLTVVAAKGIEGPMGFLGLSATHVAANPPTMMVSIGPKTSALETVRNSGAFSVNFVSQGARATAEAFMSGSTANGPDRFGRSEWTTLVTGSPVLVDALGALDCRVTQELFIAGSYVFFGEVVATHVTEGNPLIWHKGSLVS